MRRYLAVLFAFALFLVDINSGYSFTRNPVMFFGVSFVAAIAITLVVDLFKRNRE